MTALKIRIDGREVEIDSGGSQTILEAARKAGIRIPTLCHNPSIEPYGSCRLCTVQVGKNGRRRFVTACNFPVEDGLVVETCSAGVLAIRRMILELLLARCPNEGRIQELAAEYGVVNSRFPLEDENCILCGLCYRICGELVGVAAINSQSRGVERKVDTPYGELSPDCIACGACALVCPTSSALRRENIYPLLPEAIREIEVQYLDGSFEEYLGVCREIFAGRSGIEGQDGGIVTSTLLHGFERGLLDAAVVVRKDERLGAVAVLAEDANSILEARGTKYVRISVVEPLLEALQKGRRKVAVVGTPCQIRVVRKLQRQGYFARSFPDAKIYLIGLFCFESFDYAPLKGRIEELFGVDLDAAEKVQIARGKFIVQAGGREHSCKVADLGHLVRAGCGFCDDLVSMLADISVGSVGSPDGFSTVIVRSAVGERLLDGVEFERREVRREDVAKLAALKRKKAEKSFAGILAGLEEGLGAGGTQGAAASCSCRNTGISS